MLKRRWINSVGATVSCACAVVLLSLTAFGQQPSPPQQQQPSPSPPIPEQQPSPPATPMASIPTASAIGPRRPGVPRIGIVTAITQLKQGAPGNEFGEAVRQALAGYLNGPAAEAVPLEARVLVAAEIEARQKECDFILYATVSQRQRSGGFARFMGIATPVVGAIPGGATTAAAGAATTTATTTDRMLKTATTLSGNIKAKDEISVAFKLTAAGSATPKLAKVLKAKAKKDGDEVLSTLLAQAANDVLQAAMQK